MYAAMPSGHVGSCVPIGKGIATVPQNSIEFGLPLVPEDDKQSIPCCLQV